MKTRFLGVILAALAGSGIVTVPDPVFYDFPEIFFGIY